MTEGKLLKIRDLERTASRNMGSSPQADPFEHLFDAIAKACAQSASQSIFFIYKDKARLHISIDADEKDLEKLFPSLYFCECRKCYKRIRNSHAIWHEGIPYCETHAREKFE